MPSQVSAEPPKTQTVQMQEAEAPLPVAKVQTAPEPEEYPHMDEEIPPPYLMKHMHLKIHIVLM